MEAASLPALPSLHVDKDAVMAAVRETVVDMKYVDGAWTAPTLPRNASTPPPPDADLFFWRVPTSLFFGVMPTRLGEHATWNEAKERWQITHQVYNPAEARTQSETFHAKSFVGTILRGGDARYGWASQPATPSLPANLMSWSAEPRDARAGHILDDLRALAAEMLEIVKAGDPRAHVNALHLAQLEELALGAGGHAIAQAFEGILGSDSTTSYSLVARAYGGGAWRVALTFEALLSRTISLPRRLLWPLLSITVDEMFGGGVQSFAWATRRTLVGVEFLADGRTKYVKLQLGDAAPGATCWARVRDVVPPSLDLGRISISCLGGGRANGVQAES
jgi:hypothetical protein